MILNILNEFKSTHVKEPHYKVLKASVDEIRD